MYEKSWEVQDQIKKFFGNKTKENDFKCEDLVLKRDARIQEKGKHGKFDNIWKGPYRITTLLGKNNFILKYLQGLVLSGVKSMDDSRNITFPKDKG